MLPETDGESLSRQEIERSLAAVDQHLDPSHSGISKGRILGELARLRDREIAFALMDELHQANQTDDNFLAHYIDLASDSRSGMAKLLQLANDIGTEVLRRETLSRLYTKWSKYDRETAGRTFAEAGIDPAELQLESNQ